MKPSDCIGARNAAKAVKAAKATASRAKYGKNRLQAGVAYNKTSSPPRTIAVTSPRAGRYGNCFAGGESRPKKPIGVACAAAGLRSTVLPAESTTSNRRLYSPQILGAELGWIWISLL